MTTVIELPTADTVAELPLDRQPWALRGCSDGYLISKARTEHYFVAHFTAVNLARGCGYVGA